MDYNIDGFFAKRNFDTDPVTGLSKQLRAVRLDADVKLKTVKVYWDLCLISPTGAVMEVVQSGNYFRFDGNELKFTELKNSAVGLGIAQMVEQLSFADIENDLSNFPGCLDQE